MKFKLYLAITLHALNTISLMGMQPEYADENSQEYQHAYTLSRMPALVSDTDAVDHDEQKQILFQTQNEQIVAISPRELKFCKALQDMTLYAQNSAIFDTNELPYLLIKKNSFEQLQSCLYYLIGNNETYLKEHIKQYDDIYILANILNAATYVDCQKLTTLCLDQIYERFQKSFNKWGFRPSLRKLRLLNLNVPEELTKKIMDDNNIHSLLNHITKISLQSKQTSRPLYGFSPDKTICITYSEATGKVFLFNAKTLALLKTLETDDQPRGINSIQFSSDGRFLVANFTNNNQYLWNIETGRAILQGTNSKETAFSQDGILAIRNNNKVINLHDVKNNEDLPSLNEEYKSHASMILSHNSTFLAISFYDNTIHLWNVKTQKLLHRLTGHTKFISSTVFNSQETLLATASTDNTIRIWDIESGNCIHILTGHTGNINSMTFNPQGTVLASRFMDNTIRLWDVKSGNCLHVLTEHTSVINSIAFNPQGTLLASCSEDNTILLWDIESGDCLEDFEGNNFIFGPQNSLYIHKDRKTKIFSFDDHKLVNSLKNIDSSLALLLSYIAKQYITTNKPVSLDSKSIAILPDLLQRRLIKKSIITKK